MIGWFHFRVGEGWARWVREAGGGERHLLSIAFLPVFPFVIDIFCETSPFLSFINTSFYSCNVGYPRLRFHGRRFQYQFSQQAFHSFGKEYNRRYSFHICSRY